MTIQEVIEMAMKQRAEYERGYKESINNTNANFGAMQAMDALIKSLNEQQPPSEG